MTDLTTELAGLALPTPVMTAAGCGGSGRELARLCDLTALGAFVTRTVTLDSHPGHPMPRLVGTSSGVLHAVGEQNPGLLGLLATELPWLAQQRVRTVVSIAGGTLGEFAEVARRVGEAPGVSAVEVDLSAANRERDGRLFGADPHSAGKVLGVVHREVPRGVPVLAKLLPESAVVDVAEAAVEHGADALVLAHGFPATALDRETWQPSLSAGVGRLSGPAVHPMAVERVWRVHAALPAVPLVGAGGVRTGFDALEMLLAGATAVQVGTALLRDPSAADRVTAELREELDRKGLTSVADVVGSAHPLPGGS